MKLSPSAVRLLTLLTIMLTLLTAACSSSADSWSQIERRGQLRVGVDPSYPPFESLVDDQLVGIDIELMRAIGEELGMPIAFDVIAYDGLYDALLTKRVDLLASALIIDQARTRDFRYSAPYFNAGQVLVTPAASEISRFDAVTADMPLAVEVGAAGHLYASEQHPPLDIIPYPSADDALHAVTNGEAAAALTDSISARLFVADNAAVRIADDAVTVEPYALVTRSDDALLLTHIDNALEKLTQNGTLDAIIQHAIDSED